MDARQQRNAIIEARIRDASPIAWRNSWELYVSRQGIYLIRYHGSAGIYFLAIESTTGEIKDMTTLAPADMGDLDIVLTVLRAADLGEVADRAHAWYRSQRR